MDCVLQALPKTPGHREELVTPSALAGSQQRDAGDTRGPRGYCCQGRWHPHPARGKHIRNWEAGAGGWDRAEGHIRPQLRLACGACPAEPLWASGGIRTFYLCIGLYAILTFKWQWLAFKNLTPQALKDALRNVRSGTPAVSLNEKPANAHEGQNGQGASWSTHAMEQRTAVSTAEGTSNKTEDR